MPAYRLDLSPSPSSSTLWLGATVKHGKHFRPFIPSNFPETLTHSESPPQPSLVGLPSQFATLDLFRGAMMRSASRDSALVLPVVMEHGPRRAGQLGAARERIELMITAPDIDRPIRGDGRGGVHSIPGGVSPLLGPVRVDGIELVI